MVFNVHQHFLKVRQCQKQHHDLSLRKEVAAVLGIGEATVTRVVAEQNKKNNGEFQTQKILGRPKNTFDYNIPEILRSFIMSANTSGIPLSTQILRQKLEENGYKLSKWQLLRLLHKLGYYYG